MIDISDVSVEEFDADGVKVKAVLPKSDMRDVVIPSPPTVTHVPVNPRQAVIYVTDAEADDKLKAYAKENKIVFIIPAKGSDSDGIAGIYPWAVSKSTKLNIKKNQISVKGDSANMALAKEAAEIIQEDEDIGDAEEFSL
jgi:hypothetical protein